MIVFILHHATGIYKQITLEAFQTLLYKTVHCDFGVWLHITAQI